ncbi:Uncharacterized protein Adt_34727 [Abeliophyllum distichum]|uniref:Transposase MuDR plant domain-containing protein n=1 Tax=Abeliophyllum distichum TaxID=126358 RepID=A0ABD1QZY9_9LAMI
MKNPIRAKLSSSLWKCFHKSVVEIEHGQNSDATEDETYFNDSDYSLGEDENLIFEQNVTSSIELDARKESTVANEINDSDSLENSPSDELRSVHSDSEEEVVQYLEFNAEKEMMDPELEVGKKFFSKEEFKVATKNFSINNRFEVRFLVNDANRVKVICKENKCPWRVWASVMAGESTWQIKSYEWNHICNRAWKIKACLPHG